MPDSCEFPHPTFVNNKVKPPQFHKFDMHVILRRLRIDDSDELERLLNTLKWGIYHCICQADTETSMCLYNW